MNKVLENFNSILLERNAVCTIKKEGGVTQFAVIAPKEESIDFVLAIVKAVENNILNTEIDAVLFKEAEQMLDANIIKVVFYAYDDGDKHEENYFLSVARTY